MNFRFAFAVSTVCISLAVLIFFAAKGTSKPVVTVGELLEAKAPRESVRVGARVANSDIDFTTQPEPQVRFSVRDIPEMNESQSMSQGIFPSVSVIYNGIMPDTLKVERDVILEGDFDGNQFIASSLVTQCPSKYEPPIPGQSKYEE